MFNGIALLCIAIHGLTNRYVKIRFFPAIDAAHSMTPIRYNDNFKRPRQNKLHFSRTQIHSPLVSKKKSL